MGTSEAFIMHSHRTVRCVEDTVEVLEVYITSLSVHHGT
jgi:hypothetical protein